MASSASLINEQAQLAGLDSASDSILGQRIVALGGGTGLSNLLRGLKHYCFPGQADQLTTEQKKYLTAIVTVSDDGGSSSILREAYSILAPGDIRNCLLALSGENTAMKELFGFRFNAGVNNHSLGNLILTALSELESDFTRAVEIASEILDVRGSVLPATLDDVTLKAVCDDGSTIYGESNIRAAGRSIHKISLIPESGIEAQPRVIEAIDKADLIILGPGSLYTSIIPPLIVPGTAEAIAASPAVKILVMNLMTEPGETDNYETTDFLRALQRHAPQVAIDYVLVNNTPLPANLLAKHHSNGSEPIEQKSAVFSGFCCRPIFEDVAIHQNKICHDSGKLAAAIATFYSKLPPSRAADYDS